VGNYNLSGLFALWTGLRLEMSLPAQHGWMERVTMATGPLKKNKTTLTRTKSSVGLRGDEPVLHTPVHPAHSVRASLTLPRGRLYIVLLPSAAKSAANPRRRVRLDGALRRTAMFSESPAARHSWRLFLKSCIYLASVLFHSSLNPPQYRK